MSILVGSSLVHKKNTCVPFTPTRPIVKILTDIKREIKKTGIDVARPKSTYFPFCRSLWVRDSFVNIDNKIIALPLCSKKRGKNEWESIPAKRDEVFPDSPENLEGGDVIQDKNLILVGEGKRSNKSGIKRLKSLFSHKKIIAIKHTTLHLDCCLCILPGGLLLYSKRYISSLPSFLRKKYKCVKVEDIIGDKVDPNLATNMLVIGNTLITTDQAKFKKLHKYLDNKGFDVKNIKYGNLWRQHGGVRCLTNWLKVPN
jgi:N-dimethylarginine dimethylaminohydrolase